jgi:DNA-directed RNA polymerase specialized sigma24 family protein
MSWKELENDLTADLIEFMKWGNQAEYKQQAENAFRVLCFRFGPQLQKTCRIVCRNWGYDDGVGDEIAEKAFERFAKYPKYDHAKCKCGDIDKCLLLYLFGFAKNALSDYVAAIKDKRGTNPFTGDEEIVTEFFDIEALAIPAERKAVLLKEYEIIKEALARLSPKHKIIYLTYKAYDAELKAGFNFPRPFLKKLQEYLGISQSSIRAYKKEALDKIDEYLKIYGKR